MPIATIWVTSQQQKKNTDLEEAPESQKAVSLQSQQPGNHGDRQSLSLSLSGNREDKESLFCEKETLLNRVCFL